MGRVFILDPGLRKRSGHNYQMAVGVVEGMGARGVKCHVVTHREAAQDVGSTLAVEPLFSQSHYDYLSKDPYSGQFEDYLVGARKFADELKGIHRIGAHGDDLYFLPTAGPREILGLAIFLQEQKRRPRVAALFHRTEPPGTSVAPGSLTAATHRYAAKALLAATARDRILMAATTAFLARRLAAPLGLDVVTLPAPVWYPAPCAPSQTAAGPVISFLGHMKDNHGFNTIPSLAREIHRRRPEASIRIHLGAVGKRFDLGPYRALRDEGVADVIEGWLDDDQMAALYCQSTVLVMPYNRDDYREMVSAVLCTAIALGKPCVVPADSWLSEQIEAGRGSGVVYQGDETAAIADAVDAVFLDLQAHTSRAAALAEPWRREESGEALVARLLAWYQAQLEHKAQGVTENRGRAP